MNKKYIYILSSPSPSPGGHKKKKKFSQGSSSLVLPADDTITRDSQLSSVASNITASTTLAYILLKAHVLMYVTKKRLWDASGGKKSSPTSDRHRCS